MGRSAIRAKPRLSVTTHTMSHSEPSPSYEGRHRPDRPRRLLALVEQADHVSSRYRVRPLAAALAEAGWELVEQPIVRNALGFFRQLRAARADGILWQRRLSSWWRRRLLRAAAPLLLYDVDDAVFYRDSNSVKPAESRVRLRRFRRLVRTADATLVGNRFLHEQAAQFTEPERVHLFPTSIDPGGYPATAHTRVAGACQLVWIGSRSTASSLFCARPGLAAATASLPGLTTKLICDWFPDLSAVHVVPCPWSAATEVAELAAADVGISWLPDHPWSRGKPAAMYCSTFRPHLPVIANPSGVHREIIEHGRTGFLADTPEEWCHAIETLVQSPATRAQMGRDARRVVAERYNIHSRAHEFVQLLAQLSSASS